MVLLAALALTHAYETLTTTCQNAVAVSSVISVSSVDECISKCDASGQCNALDTDGGSCYLKSHCEGTVGKCSGWCGHRQKDAPVPPSPPLPPGLTLRAAAAKRGIYVGAAANQGHLSADVNYTAKLAQQYSLITAENACKWGATEPEQGSFNFGPCDDVFDFAKAHSIAFRGHNLCWGNGNPSWLENGKWSGEQKRGFLVDHAQTVANHYGDGAIAWDVVNEAVSDSASGGDVKLKDNVWSPDVRDYIDVAFNATRAKYKGKLFYNDYNIGSTSVGALELHPRTGEVLTMGSKGKSDAATSGETRTRNLLIPRAQPAEHEIMSSHLAAGIRAGQGHEGAQPTGVQPSVSRAACSACAVCRRAACRSTAWACSCTSSTPSRRSTASRRIWRGSARSASTSTCLQPDSSPQSTSPGD